MFGLTKKLAGWAAGRLKGEKARQKTMDWMEKTGVGQLISGAGDAAILGGAGKLAGAGLKAAGAKLGFGKAAALPSGDLPARKGFLGIGKRAQMTPNFDAAGNITGYSPVTDPMADLARSRASQIPGLPISDAARNDAIRASLEQAQVGIGANIERGMAGLKNVPGMEQFGGPVAQRPMFGGRMSEMVRQGAQDYIGRNPTMMERAGSALRGAGGMVRGAGSALMRRPEIAAAGLGAMTQARQGAANRAVQERQLAQQAAQFQQTFGQSEEERKREIERQQRIAQMLAPLFQRVSGGQG